MFHIRDGIILRIHISQHSVTETEKQQQTAERLLYVLQGLPDEKFQT
jgi:hypothetical protein